ncbi:CHC2 zinc finger domain-containing protein [uncultured Parabacteroides sp.]|uniref:DNA primase n=1 Tax=uncultured Parabacteroides sp. TaxID=512312 RepID=UPI0025CCEF0F|nr:CHC2 zinc finger domain-containing protein [uncultured Parabacteroides sp.]
MTKKEIEELKSSLHIEEVIGKSVKLERKGANYIGLCPFHNDHHPSLMVNPEKQTFHCFACGEHGDAIGFIEKMEHCGFMEAVGKLAFDREKLTGRKKRNINSDAKHLSTVTRQLSTEKNLQFLSSLLPYACGNSELTPSYLDFEVGQSPVNVPREWYIMRNRIIFPIRDEAGELVAFAARRLADGKRDEPKYINSSTADGYKKSENLYALYRAKRGIEEQGFIFLVEGYKDAIAMHAAGFTNTVALCGTALTAGQLILLQKYTKRICLLLDGDIPGREAARKISLSLDPASMEVQTIPLPEGEDPDSLFRRLGKDAFVSLIHRYQSKPHLSEELLLTASLLFADTYYMFKGSLCLFAELLNSILETDNLLLENKENRMILAHLAEGYLESDLPPALKEIADELHTEYDLLVYNEKEQFESLYPHATNVMDMYLTRLFFLYTENRILRDIQKQVRLLLETTPEKKKKRLAILVHIAERREQLRHVSENLDRPGAVWY